MASGGRERLYRMNFEVARDGTHAVPAPALVESVAGVQQVVYLLAKFKRGEELGQRASFSRALRDAFALQCRVPEPGSYVMPFEIGNPAHSLLAPKEALDVDRLFRRVTAAVGGGDIDGARALVPNSRYLDCLRQAYRKATPPPRTGVSYWIEDHRRRRILDSRKSEAALDHPGWRTPRSQRVREATIAGILVAMDFDQRRLRLTRPDGKWVSAYYDEDSERPLIDHRRGWIELTGDVRYDADGRALSVTHARDFVAFDEDTIELRNVSLCKVSYRVSPPLRFRVKFDADDQLYDLEGEFGISVSASSQPDLHHELQDALSMLWIEYGLESPHKLSPKARQLRIELRKRLTAA